MGQGAREDTTCTFSNSVSPLFLEDRLSESVGSPQSMAAGHSRSSSCDSSVCSSAGYIEHTVSRFDTLAGVAIKYGVEVGDVKRMNGLTTDLQMFALKTLKIPLPGRHPPSSSPNSPGYSGVQPTPRLGKYPNLALAQILKDSSNNKVQEKRPITSAMGLLRGYYGLSTSTTRQSEEGMEMAVYKSDSDYQSEDEPFSPHKGHEVSEVRPWLDNHGPLDCSATVPRFVMRSNDNQREQHSNTYRARTSKWSEDPSKSNTSTLLRPQTSGDSGGVSEVERANERSVRRRGKGEGVSPFLESPMEVSTAPDTTDRITVPLGKSSVLRPKIVTKIDFDEEASPPRRSTLLSPTNGWHTSIDNVSTGSAARALGATLLGGKTVEGLISKIRRSASNPTIHEDRRSYKGDSSPLITVSPGGTPGGVISSVLEGFPKPGAVRRNKAALD